MSRKTAAIAESRTKQLMYFGIAAFAALAMTAFAALASDDLDQGLKVGQTIPLSMEASDQNGDTRSLKSLPGRSGMILLFTRSLDW